MYRIAKLVSLKNQHRGSFNVIRILFYYDCLFDACHHIYNRNTVFRKFVIPMSRYPNLTTLY